MLWLLGLLGAKGLALAMLLSMVGSFGAGAYAMNRWNSVSEYKAEISALNRKLHTIQLAQEKDAKAAVEAASKAELLQGKVNELLSSKIVSPNTACFSKSESDSLRGLWD
jgi:hypothetical protein